MRRFGAAALGSMLALGCTDDESTETLTSFGSASASGPVSTTSDATSSMSDPSDASTATDSTGDAETVTSGATTSDPTGDSTSESTTDPTTDPTSDSGSSSSSSGDTGGSGGSGDLGECVGLGVWASCSQYCAAIVEVCVEGGCGGSTAVYYGDAQACIDQSGGSGSNQGCNEGFDQSGGASFARCCCG